jgi:hypothetical protein
MKNLLLVICLLSILMGCATTKTLQPIGGSKADGTVTLAYEYNAFENPQIDWNLAKATAKSRCTAWGYGNAEAFGGQRSRDTLCSNSGACYGQQVYITYQCTK